MTPAPFRLGRKIASRAPPGPAQSNRPGGLLWFAVPLIAGIGWFLDPGNWHIVAAVAVGIGMVIFVHELGHFAVAKWCGVKCEKFYLGFDIGGWKLFKYQRGETEYGIGILPLGGYVKMLGQEDNPQRMQEEFERSKIRPEAVAASKARAPAYESNRTFPDATVGGDRLP